MAHAAVPRVQTSQLLVSSEYAGCSEYDGGIPLHNPVALASLNSSE